MRHSLMVVVFFLTLPDPPEPSRTTTLFTYTPVLRPGDGVIAEGQPPERQASSSRSVCDAEITEKDIRAVPNLDRGADEKIPGGIAIEQPRIGDFLAVEIGPLHVAIERHCNKQSPVGMGPDVAIENIRIARDHDC